MKNLYLLATSALCAAAILGPARAQTAAPATSQASNTGNDAEVIVVTARKREERAFDVPDSITTFSAAKIQQLGLKDFEEFTALIPSAAVAESGFGIERSIYIRGIGTPALLEDPGVGYYVDDVYMGGIVVNPAQFYDLERVEVLRGPQGGLYGQDAVGGSINFISARPTDQFEGSLEATYANFQREELIGTINVPLADDFAVRGTAWFTNQSQGELYNSYLHQYVDANSSAGGRIVAVASPTSKLEFTLIAETSENQGPENYYTIPYTYGGAPYETQKTIQRNTPSLLTLNTNRISPQLKYETDIGTFELITAYKTYSLRSLSDQDFSIVPPNQVIYRHDSFSGYFSEFRWLSPSDSPFRWVLGANYLTNSGSSDINVVEGSGYPGDFYRNNIQTDHGWDAFAEAYYDIIPTVELDASVRYSEDTKTLNYLANATDYLSVVCSYGDCFADTSSATHSNLSPGGSLTWKPTDDLRIYAKVQTGFRNGGYNFVANAPQDLTYNPETSISFEVGAKKTFWDGRLETDISLYKLHQNHVLVYESDDLADNYDFFKNVGTADTYGMELEAKAQITDELSLDGSLSLMDPQIVSGIENAGTLSAVNLAGHTLPYAPRRTIGITADYRHPILDGAATLVMDASLSDRHHTWNDVDDDAAAGEIAENFDIINLRAGIEYGNYSFTLWTKNLTDDRYIVSGPAYAGPGLGYEYAEGTTYGITLRAKF